MRLCYTPEYNTRAARRQKSRHISSDGRRHMADGKKVKTAMMIKKRIAISNILMLLIPIAMILTLAGLMFLSYSNLYAWPEQNLMSEYRKTYQAQQAIKSSSNIMEYAQDQGEVKRQRNALIAELGQLGYYLRISGEEDVAYSNLTPMCEELLNGFEIKKESSPDFFAVETGSASIIHGRMFIDNKPYDITAINPAHNSVDIDLNSHAKMMYRYAAILLILSLVIVVVTNIIITGKMAKALIKPLELLSYGTSRIKDGNLDFKIHYDCRDEFGQLCSDFNEMRLRLRESVEIRLKYEEDRKELIAGISHDLRTPLTAIKGYVKGVLDGVANTPEKQAHYLDTIYTQACNMDMLVDKLFLFSRLDTGHFPFHFETVNAGRYIETFLSEASDKFSQSGLTISFENKCESSLLATIDKSEMGRVITNILENSVKYKTKAECHMHITISLDPGKGKHDKKFIVIELADDGEGATETSLPHLFKSFYRADPSRTNTSKSSGLGLSIADRIIKAHNGTISAENRGGLCVIIKLPVIKEVAENE